MMMDVLPPKWTELFQHQQQQEIAEQREEHNESTHSHRSCHWHIPTHYNTYHDSCTIHPFHDRDHHQQHHLLHSPHQFRTQSHSSNPSMIEPMSSVEKENETQLRGTRFRLTKATIRTDDEEPQHQQLNTEHHYV